MSDQRVQYMPLPNAASQAFIDANVDEAERTGDLQTDFRKALVAVIDSVEDENKYTLDDLWKLYIEDSVASDSNAEDGNPASGGGGGGGGDENFDSVELLLPFTTETGMNDQSANGFTGTANGDAAISTAIADPFGNTDGVLALDGTGDHVVINPPGTELDIDTSENFTIEWWGYLSSVQNTSWFSVDANWYAYNNFYRMGGANHAMDTTPPADQWVHFAISRADGANIETYVDGTRESTSASTVGDAVSALDIGHYAPNNNLNVSGYISNFRWTVGVGRYTGASIDVPTEAFPTTADGGGGDVQGGHVGQGLGQYYTEEFLDDKDGSRAGGGPGFPGGGSQGFGSFEDFTLTSDSDEWDVIDAISGFRWNDDGTRGYICTDDGLVHRIFKGAVESTTAYELLGQVYTNDDTVFDGGDRIRDFAWNEDGTGIFGIDYDAARIKEYNGTAGAAYNLTDINNTSVASFATHTQPLAIDISADGTKFYTVNNSSGAIHQYGASVAWDISTLSQDGTVTPSWPDGGGTPKANAFRMSSDGKSFIMTNQSDSTISRWTLDGDPFDLTGGVSLDTSLSVYSPSNYLNALDVNPSNTKLTVIDDDTSGGKIYNFGKDESAFESEVVFEAGSVVHPDYSISGGGRTLSKSSNNLWRIAMANRLFYQGKWYFEVEVLTAPENLLMVGIANDAQTLADFLGKNGYSWGWQSDAVAGIIRHNNGQVNVPALAGASTNGDIMMVAWDHAEQKLWYGLNGTWDGDPAAGTGSKYVNMDVPVRPAVATYQNQTNICRANFAEGDMTYSPPTGFSPVSPV